MVDNMNVCPDCMGSGFGGHPDSGELCSKCGGLGGISALPEKEGFFWALHPEGGAFIGEVEPIENWWMPVEVFEGDDELVVAVFGLLDAQPLKGFLWGDEIVKP